MFWTNFRRITKAGVVSFWRNGWVSFATILVMVLALFVLGSLLFSNVLLSSAIDAVEKKVDVSVYFKVEATEADILSMKETIERLPQVENAGYVSREDALSTFKERHSGNALISGSLEELGDNPFGASLNIRAKDPSQYGMIARFLEEGNFNIVDNVNYRKNKLVIDRLAAITLAARKLGIGISLVLGFIAMLVAFNTIRLAIFTSREEINIMKLVGASRRYIRAPFLIEGFLHGVLASIITTLFFWPLTFWLGPELQSFFGGINIYEYFTANLFQFFSILFLAGAFLGVLSSFVATRRYLKV